MTEKLRQALNERGIKFREYGGVTKGTMEPYSRYVIDGDDGYVRAIIEADSRDEVLLTLRCGAEHAIDALSDKGTCSLVDNDSGPDMHCSACGGQIDDEYPYFAERYGYSRCPHCGRRIVE